MGISFGQKNTFNGLSRVLMINFNELIIFLFCSNEAWCPYHPQLDFDGENSSCKNVFHVTAGWLRWGVVLQHMSKD